VRFVSGGPAPGTAGRGENASAGLYRARRGTVMLRFDVCTSPDWPHMQRVVARENVQLRDRIDARATVADTEIVPGRDRRAEERAMWPGHFKIGSPTPARCRCLPAAWTDSIAVQRERSEIWNRRTSGSARR
jgi:hypothetical protein